MGTKWTMGNKHWMLITENEDDLQRLLHEFNINHIKYLGINLLTDINTEEEVKPQVTRARRTTAWLNDTIWWNKKSRIERFEVYKRKQDFNHNSKSFISGNELIECKFTN